MSNYDFTKYRYLARVAKANNIEQYFKQPNIVGMAFGRRTVGDTITDEPAIVIYVMKKVGKNFLPLSHLLPRKIYIGGDCINVDVIETGPLYSQSFTGKERPAPSGISCSHFDLGGAGTLGCLVRDKTDGSLCILSNNHVLAKENAATIGDNILQPGTGPDSGSNPGDAIATLKRFVTINPTGNVVDCAIGQVTHAGDVVDQMKNNLMDVPTPNHPAVGLLFAGGGNRTILNPINQVLNSLNIEFTHGPGATVLPEIKMNVEKVGRTTEYTTSTITEIDVTATIGYSFGNATFDHQIATAWLSCPGDSGSIVCRGGKGGTTQGNCPSCGSTQAAQSLLQRNLKNDVDAEKIFRDKYLSNTKTGRYLLDTFFANEDYIVKRFNASQAAPEDVSYAQYLYERYAETFRKMAINPEDSTQVVTRDQINDASHGLGRIDRYLHSDEREAARQLFEIVRSFEGRRVSEVLNMLDDNEIYNRVVRIVSSVEGLQRKPC